MLNRGEAIEGGARPVQELPGDSVHLSLAERVSSLSRILVVQNETAKIGT